MLDHRNVNSEDTAQNLNKLALSEYVLDVQNATEVISQFFTRVRDNRLPLLGNCPKVYPKIIDCLILTYTEI